MPPRGARLENKCIPLLSHLFGAPASELWQGVHLLKLKTIELCAAGSSTALLMLRCSNLFNLPGKEVGFRLDYQNCKST